MNNAERRHELRAEMEVRRDRAFRAAPAWRTRPRRRGLVVLLALVLAAAATAPGDVVVVVVGLVATCAVGVVLRVLTRGVAESTDAQLDERDRALRDRAIRWSYVIAMCGVAVVTLYVSIAAQQPGLTERVIKVLAVLFVGMIVAPTAVLAWMLPSDDPEDVDDSR